eukprot:scaffold18654_cov66-Phaeocystis_antarctica.AAC.2
MCAFRVVSGERTSSRCCRSASLSACRSAMPSPAFLACAIAAASLLTRDGTESPASISRESESCVSPPPVHSCCSSYTAVSSIVPQPSCHSFRVQTCIELEKFWPAITLLPHRTAYSSY